jgi:acyl dehydratase/NADP-dependent 3-hydroxy acid dehydrogenase YdfG
MFTDAEQRDFARLSGDRNPMHLDPLAARRLLAGRPVVHGVHVLLSSVERWRNDGNLRAANLACTFENPVGVGEVVVFRQHDDARGRAVIEALVEDVVCARTVITTAAEDTAAAAHERSTRPVPQQVDGVTEPWDEAPERHLGRSYAVTLQDSDLFARFSHAQRYLGPQALPAIAALSYFAGMICPGRHSVLSSLKMDVGDRAAADTTLHITVDKYHANVRLFDMTCDGPIRGRLQAFLRRPPQDQPSVMTLAPQVGAEEFRGTRSLVVGGSRGLGEVTAKLLAAGGGDVTLTYRAGRDDAYRVRDEINAAGTGAACEALPFDVTTDAWEQLALERRQLDAVYFFPTPRIFRKGAAVFSPKRFEEFSEIYLSAFFALCEALERHAGKAVRVFFPSSAAVVERPKGLTEYAMAKAAAEVLVDDINRSFKQVSVVSSRLPRLSTDQTASILDVPAESNVDTLLPIIRKMYR